MAANNRNQDVIHRHGIIKRCPRCPSNILGSNVLLTARSQALTSLQNNKFFMGKVQIAAAAEILKKPPTVPSNKPVKRLSYYPLEKEATRRQADLELKSFQMNKPYMAYGSSNGEWRAVVCGRKFTLPEGCAPRRSQRFM
jgi:hypothetical protein